MARLVHNPSENYKERDDEKRDLNRRSDRNTQREVDFVVNRNRNCGNMLGSISDDWQKDQSDPFCADFGVRVGQTVDRGDEEFGGDYEFAKSA